MEIKKKDFIEINFTGKTKEGIIFDSTLKSEMEKIPEIDKSKIQAKPFIFCIGGDMFLKSIEDFLIGKEIGKKYEKELNSEEAFGKRDASLIQRIPLRIFIEKKINPFPGASFNFDGRIGKILTVSGGRVIVDFNSPLAGKSVIYEIEILRKIEEAGDKVRALNDFFFRRDFDFKIENKKIIFNVEKEFIKILELFKEKFREILEFEIEINEKEDIKENKKDIKTNKKAQ